MNENSKWKYNFNSLTLFKKIYFNYRHYNERVCAKLHFQPMSLCENSVNQRLTVEISFHKFFLDLTYITKHIINN